MTLSTLYNLLVFSISRHNQPYLQLTGYFIRHYPQFISKQGLCHLTLQKIRNLWPRACFWVDITQHSRHFLGWYFWTFKTFSGLIFLNIQYIFWVDITEHSRLFLGGYYWTFKTFFGWILINIQDIFFLSASSFIRSSWVKMLLYRSSGIVIITYCSKTRLFSNFLSLKSKIFSQTKILAKYAQWNDYAY